MSPLSGYTPLLQFWHFNKGIIIIIIIDQFFYFYRPYGIIESFSRGMLCCGFYIWFQGLVIFPGTKTKRQLTLCWLRLFVYTVKKTAFAEPSTTPYAKRWQRSGRLQCSCSLRSKRFRASSSRKPKFRAITRLETLATQARIWIIISDFLFVPECDGFLQCIVTLGPVR